MLTTTGGVEVHWPPHVVSLSAVHIIPWLRFPSNYLHRKYNKIQNFALKKLTIARYKYVVFNTPQDNGMYSVKKKKKRK